jgi:hypothetical protein
MNKVEVFELIKMNSYTLIGLILGICAYIKSNEKENGKYNIGLSKYFEYSLIPIYVFASLYSNEKISKTLLAAEGGFHFGIFIKNNF